MAENKCKRCGKVLRNQESIKLGYGKTCYKIVQLQETNKQETNTNIPQIDELLNRIRKLELDNTFIKIQLKHKVFSKESKDDELDWDLKPEIKKVKDETKIQFTILIKELNIIFKREDDDIFDYHNVLKPIDPIDIPINPPIIMVEI